jgi:hypothetical protein
MPNDLRYNAHISGESISGRGIVGMGTDHFSTQGIWVSPADGAEITGFTVHYLEILAQQQAALPEKERSLKIRLRDNRYEFWMPDLVRHMMKRDTKSGKA